MKKPATKYSWVSLDEILDFLKDMPVCDLTRRVVEHIPQEYRNELPTAHNVSISHN